MNILTAPRSSLLAVASRLVLTGLLAGCAANGDPNMTARQELTRELRAACIAAGGGLQMDAVDLYGGDLARQCTHWAYQRARRAVSDPTK